MPGNLKDILSHLNTEIDQETLLLYLQDKVPADVKHEIEKKLAENEFANDALEGLQDVKDKRQIAHTVEMLNRELEKKVDEKKRRREKLKWKEQPWLYLVIFIFLMLIVLCYMVLHRMMNAS